MPKFLLESIRVIKFLTGIALKNPANLDINEI